MLCVLVQQNSSTAQNILGQTFQILAQPLMVVLSVGTESNVSCDHNVLPINNKYKHEPASKSCTSMTTPLVSGNATIVQQYFSKIIRFLSFAFPVVVLDQLLTPQILHFIFLL